MHLANRSNKGNQLLNLSNQEFYELEHTNRKRVSTDTHLVMIDTIRANAEMVNPIILVADDQVVLKDPEGQACNRAGQKVGEQGNLSLVSSMLTDLRFEILHSKGMTLNLNVCTTLLWDSTLFMVFLMIILWTILRVFRI